MGRIIDPVVTARAQFAIFGPGPPGTRVSGEAGLVVTSLFRDGAVAAEPVTVVEIGVLGEYVVSFTPTAGFRYYELVIDLTGTSDLGFSILAEQFDLAALDDFNVEGV